MAKFVDYAEISCRAGDGGAGHASFRREKYVPRGGPDGGDGGKGGDVVVVGERHMATLLDFKYKSAYRAPAGRPGGRKNCSGRSGEDLVIAVPLGVEITDAESERLVADIVRDGQRVIVCHGGAGGRGNSHFVSSTNQAPTRVEEGQQGEQRRLILELKAIADIGLVGLPNAGKSTLLATMTAATPKVAGYPFTTLHPNLGVMDFDFDTRLVLADLPGLIEGASQGAGLGARFLRHIERTGRLLHLVTDEEGVFDCADIEERVRLVRRELLFYGRRLADKSQTLAISQIDRAIDREQLEATRAALAEKYGPVLAFSSKTGEGLEQVRALLRSIAQDNVVSRASQSPAREGG